MPRLSVCLITKNESRDLARCLASVRGLADEIVVVDTGTTDDTVAIAQAHGARVLHHAWRHDFADARNVSLDAATGDWVLVLDADDEVPSDTAAQIPCLLAEAERARPPIDGLTMLYHSPMPAGEAVAFTEYPVLRLFRNRPEFRFRQAIHEQVLPAIQAAGGRVDGCALRLTHYGYLRPTTGISARLSRAARRGRSAIARSSRASCAVSPTTRICGFSWARSLYARDIRGRPSCIWSAPRGLRIDLARPNAH